MKTPSEHRKEQELRKSQAEKDAKIQYEHDFTYCRNFLIEKSYQRTLDIKFGYVNYGAPGKVTLPGSYPRKTIQKVDVQNAVNILKEAGWVARKCPKFEELETTCIDTAGMKREMHYGDVEVSFPEDVEVGELPSGEEIWKPSEYLAVLKGKLDTEVVQKEVSRTCDIGLSSLSELSIERIPHWKIRQHILVPYVRDNGWVVEELPDKIVIKYPEEHA